MKRIAALAFLFFAFAAFLFAPAWAEQESAPSAPTASATAQPNGPSPRIVFSELEHDFGTLGARQTAKHTFKFRNEGNATLVVGDVKSTCGCTGTLLSKKEIAPGENGEIEVTFNSGNSSGQKKKSIYVSSNDLQQPKLELHIMAKVVIPVELKPLTLYWSADKNQPPNRRAELVLDQNVKLNVTKLESSSPAFKASVQPRKIDESGGYYIDVTYDGTLPPGEHRATLSVLTDNPEYSKLDIALICKVTGPVRAVPEVATLGVIKDDTLPTRIIRLYSTSGKSFEITEIKSTNPILKAEFSKENVPNSYQVKVSLTAKPPLGAFSEKLLIQTNDPEQASLQIPVHAFVQ
ncbi:DUF1573 domain-containing protein [Candidatus Poribacteria bacterium]|nr:DUF1573 domain-containing protein [Candidatus Poribacteria bacterium]